MFEDLIANNPGDTFFNFYNAFITYFSSLELPAQIMTGVLIVLGLIGLGYLIYGALWVAYQAVKFSIMISIISVALSIELIVIIFVAIFDHNRLSDHTSEFAYNMKYIVHAFYPKTEAPEKPTKKQPNQIVVFKPQQPSIQKPAAPQHYVEHKIPVPERRAVNHYEQAQKAFCPNCGEEFSSRMLSVLDEKMFTFCEQCGEKFFRRQSPSGINSQVHA